MAYKTIDGIWINTYDDFHKYFNYEEVRKLVSQEKDYLKALINAIQNDEEDPIDG